MHTQMFKRHKNDLGYVSVIVNVDEFKDDLKSLGFVESVDDINKESDAKKAKAAAKAAAKAENQEE